MRVGFLQFKVEFGKPELNKDKVSQLIGSNHFDLLVLPELCFSGYFMSSRQEAFQLSEPFGNGPSFEFASQLAKQGNGAVVFGFPERDGDRVFNSAAMICPDGKNYLYRKSHLFFREKEWFDPGDTGFKVFEFRDARIGMMICFDWQFPESSRTLMLNGADIICHPSNLVLPYCQDAMVTRCLENRIYAITCNRIGTDRQGEDEFSFTGRSQITACKGEILARAQDDEEIAVFVEIDPHRSRDKSITALNEMTSDRRSDLYFK